MVGVASSILTVVFILAAAICLFYLLYLLAQEKDGIHAVMGFFIPPYPYVWGWLNSSRLGIVDVMAFWTFVSIASVAFPLAMAAVSVPTAALPSSDPSLRTVPSTSSDAVVQGQIARGSQVEGRLDDLFAVDEWTLEGEAGEQISIFCWPAAGSDTDPRVTVLGPGREEVVSDDDGGEGFSAQITNFTLPETGTYRIRVAVWSAGPYVLSVE